MNVCESCGAVQHGNLTCPECRRVMRAEGSASNELLDILDAAGLPVEPPCGPEALASMLLKLGIDPLKEPAFLDAVEDDLGDEGVGDYFQP